MSDKIINLPINEYSEPKPHEIEIMNSVFNEPGFNYLILINTMISTIVILLFTKYIKMPINIWTLFISYFIIIFTSQSFIN